MADRFGGMEAEELRRVYNIREAGSLAGFLLPGHSLCVLHRPVWRPWEERTAVDASPGGRVRLIKVVGHDRRGAFDELLLGLCGPDDQGYYRQKLDENLKSPFLFATWKRGCHGFRLIRERQTMAHFSAFEEALAAYLPAGFMPVYSLERRKITEDPVFDPDSLEIGDGILG